MSFPTRKIGNTHVSAIGWGAMGISAFYGAPEPDEERLKVLDRACELGMTHWDTAALYEDSEELIGKWFAKTGKRSSIFLATKFGYREDWSITGDPADVRKQYERSAKRLGVDCIDLYYAHRIDPTIPVEHTVAAMAELVKEGKVKYLGLSEPSPATLRRAHAVHPIAAIEVEYSPFELYIERTNPKDALLATARELGVKIIAYSPLGRGLLAGKFKSVEDIPSDDFRGATSHFPRFFKENFAKTLAFVEQLKSIAARHNATTGQICLAWLLAQGEDIIPIPGTRRIKYLEENAGAVNVKLSVEELLAIRNAAVATGASEVPRYGDAAMSETGVDTPLPKGA